GILNLELNQAIMILVSLFFMYLSIVKKYEPLLLLPLAFGILIANLPSVGLHAYHFNQNNFEGVLSGVVRPDMPGTWVPGLMNFLYSGIRMVIYPPLVFLCLGTMTDFGPLISNPKSAFIGIGGQLGIFVAFFISLYVVKFIPGFTGFTEMEAAAIGIIGSSDGPTAIYAATRLAPHLLPPIAIAAFSYMALVPFIQPPIMKLSTTKKERVIVMPEPKRVTQKQKVIFPIVCTILTLLFVPAAGALISMLMLGNLIRESGVADRYVRAFQNDLLSILTFLVALSIGSSAQAATFLQPQTLVIIACGLIAFAFGTVGGILVAKLLCLVTGGKVNPLIGNSGVSAMPMAARISQRMGQQYNPENHLLMHAMGPIVSSTIGSAIVAGIFISYFVR
ncbi:MAG: sodium ion-translocating decarboxylase subunit beta, partial [Treponema sp.]|nr:sodium ion-translocating decarboxylase subunit beta [Treponema sp.]